MVRGCPKTDGAPTHAAEYLQATWNQLNDRYFRQRLLPINILWSSRLKSSAGMFVNRVGPRYRNADPGRRLIRLSSPLLRQQHEQEIIGTLAHEMIHQWQYDVLRRRPNHGPDFIHKMEEMNRDGLGVTLRHALDDSVQALSKYTWRCGGCGRLYRRQRRTIRPRRHRCGTCQGRLHEVRFTHVDKHTQTAAIRRPTPPGARTQAVQLELPITSS